MSDNFFKKSSRQKKAKNAQQPAVLSQRQAEDGSHSQSQIPVQQSRDHFVSSGATDVDIFAYGDTQADAAASAGQFQANPPKLESGDAGYQPENADSALAAPKRRKTRAGADLLPGSDAAVAESGKIHKRKRMTHRASEVAESAADAFKGSGSERKRKSRRLTSHDSSKNPFYALVVENAQKNNIQLSEQDKSKQVLEMIRDHQIRVVRHEDKKNGKGPDSKYSQERFVDHIYSTQLPSMQETIDKSFEPRQTENSANVKNRAKLEHLRFLKKKLDDEERQWQEADKLLVHSDSLVPVHMLDQVAQERAQNPPPVEFDTEMRDSIADALVEQSAQIDDLSITANQAAAFSTALSEYARGLVRRIKEKQQASSQRRTHIQTSDSVDPMVLVENLSSKKV